MVYYKEYVIVSVQNFLFYKIKVSLWESVFGGWRKVRSCFWRDLRDLQKSTISIQTETSRRNVSIL